MYASKTWVALHGQMKGEFEKIFDSDSLSKRERVERTLNLKPVAALPLTTRSASTQALSRFMLADR
jgi:hypothetical protein